MSARLLRRNRLSFPAGRMPSGIVSNHIASSGLRFSGIVNNANFRSLTNPIKLGSITAPGPGYTIDSIMGPATLWTGAESVWGLGFSAYPAVADTSQTIAAIVSFSSFAATNSIFTNGQSGGGGATVVQVSTAGVLQVQCPSQGPTSGPTLALNTPYFIAVSITSGIQNFLARSLATGIISTATAATTYTPSASTGVYEVGGWQSGNLHMAGNIAAVMMSSGFLSLSQLKLWAQDPWSFWYPRLIFFNFKPTSVAISPPTRTLMGVGV